MKKISFKKLRLWFMYPLFFVYPFVAKANDIYFLCGVFFIILGLSIRFWASGYIMKSRVLATSGPYAYTRNPLYLGNFILGFGIAAISGSLWLVFYYFLAFLILYVGTIKEEQASLEAKFGSSYRDYTASVPMFFPSLKPYERSDKSGFSLKQSFKNGEFIRFFGFLLVPITFYLFSSLVLKKEYFNSASQVAVLLFIVFFALLWFNIYIRRKSQKESNP
jgi:protein-S-isoprenylcysteine O-methyltransferase Ste14